MIGFRGLVDRFNAWLRPTEELVAAVDDPNLRVVACTRDASESATAVLERAHLLNPDLPAVLRHYLGTPPGQVETALEILGQDGWHVRVSESDVAADPDDLPDSTPTTVTVVAVRAQHLSAMHCARENSRMVGLAQRLGGSALGWDVLQPPAPR